MATRFCAASSCNSRAMRLLRRLHPSWPVVKTPYMIGEGRSTADDDHALWQGEWIDWMAYMREHDYRLPAQDHFAVALANPTPTNRPSSRRRLAVEGWARTVRIM
jgi:hypothetical protein